MTVDSNDNVWIADTSAGVVDKFDAGGNYLTQAAGHSGGWPEGGGYIRSPAYSNASNQVYDADSNHDEVWVFDEHGAAVTHWSNSEFGGGCCYVYAAADNSGTSTDGTIFISRNSNHTVYRFDGNDTPANFAGSASYIDGNQLTGTPGHEFNFNPEGARLAVDPAGDLIVANPEGHAVDVFNSAGIFQFELTETDSGSLGEVRGVAVDPTSDDILLVDAEHSVIDEYTASGEFVETITGDDTPTGSFSGNLRDLAVDSTGRLYVSDAGNSVVDVLSPNVVLPKVTYKPTSNPGQTSMTVNATIDPNEGGDVVECQLEYGTTSSYGSTAPCTPDPGSSHFSTSTDVSATLAGLVTEETYHYRFVVANANGTKKGADRQFVPHAVVGLTTDPATAVEPTAATLNGSWEGNGEDTHYYFEWGATTAYGHITAAPPGIDQGSTPGPTAVTAEVTGINPVTTYHYRIVASNGAGTSLGEDQYFTTPPNRPLVNVWVTTVHSDSVVLHADINPGGGFTKYHFEWGAQNCEVGSCEIAPIPDGTLADAITPEEVAHLVTGLSAGTTYHFRVVASNSHGTTEGEDSTFTTFPYTPVVNDPCPNAHERQQTGAALLFDCRAYELVSAGSTDGYDVESSLIAGQRPFGGYPYAEQPPRVLYAVHQGVIPNTGRPTNFGPDPYVATRTEHGWITSYVGIPADGTPSVESFSSTPSAADAALDTFVFGGPELCSPCFPDGTTGLPVRLADGELVQGMSGSQTPGPSATREGFVGRQLSADGSHLIFGSTAEFSSDGNGNGDISIYDRNLPSGVTHVVSKTPGGATMTGPGIGELDLSQDGSRVVVGQLVATDADGNAYWHLYMDIGDANQTVDLTPGTTTGVLYDGMSSDGARVFFSTRDQLAAGDTDTSSDIYEAEVGSSSATVSRLSTGAGGTGNTDSCDPNLNSDRAHWNTVEGLNCDAVAIAGGGGAFSGGIYFLSPELLDGPGSGVPEEPNLYVAKDGAPPEYIATLEPDNALVRDALADNSKYRSSDFETTPSGDFALFASTTPLTGYPNAGHAEVYRYSTASGSLQCVSCAPTGAQSTADSSLAKDGLSITQDGRVFFDSSEPLTPNDLNGHQDVFEWENGSIGLISTGAGPFDSQLLTASANGVDVQFFTRDQLAVQDENGNLMKIYDAREEGGFASDAPFPPCAASDECHGPGTQPPAPPNVNTVQGTGGNEQIIGGKPNSRCRPGTKPYRGRCVAKHHRRKHGPGRHRGSRRHG